MITVTPISRASTEWITTRKVVPEPLHDVLVVWMCDGELSVDLAFRKPDGRWVMTHTELEVEPLYWSPLPALPQEAA